MADSAPSMIEDSVSFVSAFVSVVAVLPVPVPLPSPAVLAVQDARDAEPIHMIRHNAIAIIFFFIILAPTPQSGDKL